MEKDIGNRFIRREILDVSARGTPGIFRVSKTRGILVTGREHYLLRTRGGAFTSRITIGYRLLNREFSRRGSYAYNDRCSSPTFCLAVVKHGFHERSLRNSHFCLASFLPFFHFSFLRSYSTSESMVT